MPLVFTPRGADGLVEDAGTGRFEEPPNSDAGSGIDTLGSGLIAGPQIFH
jgi:hypothetical protein